MKSILTIIAAYFVFMTAFAYFTIEVTKENPNVIGAYKARVNAMRERHKVREPQLDNMREAILYHMVTSDGDTILMRVQYVNIQGDTVTKYEHKF
jgi:hypothetical protein